MDEKCYGKAIVTTEKKKSIKSRKEEWNEL